MEIFIYINSRDRVRKRHTRRRHISLIKINVVIIMANNINVCNKTVFKLVLFGKHMRWCVEIKLHTGRQRAKSNVLYGANRIRFFFLIFIPRSVTVYIDICINE